MGKKKKSKASLQPKLPDRDRWYRLMGQFDESTKKATPISGAFLRGKLDNITIVEVEKGFPEDKLGELGQWLEGHSIEAMIVTEGIKFLRLGPATPDQNAILEAHYAEANKPPPREGPPEPKLDPHAIEGRSI